MLQLAALLGFGLILFAGLMWGLRGMGTSPRAVGILAGLAAIVVFCINSIVALIALAFSPGYFLHGVRVAVAALIFFGLSFLCAFVAKKKWEHDFAAIRDYPRQVDPWLQAYRRDHGRYPANLAEIPGVPPMPSGLSYEGQADEFYFRFPDDWDTLFGGAMEYSMQSNDWYLDD